MLPIPIIANYEMIRQHRQAVIDTQAAKQNLRRLFRDYEVGDEVLVKVKDPSKLQPRLIGPYVIEVIHVNGTITIRRNEHVYERINIRCVQPYHRRG